MEDLTSPEVADLLGVSQEQFSKFWQVCQRYPGSFPAPIRTIGRSQVWSLTEVCDWQNEHEAQDISVTVEE